MAEFLVAVIILIAVVLDYIGHLTLLPWALPSIALVVVYNFSKRYKK